jgi:hypothetical protein
MEQISGQLIMPGVAEMIQEHKAAEYQAFVDKFKEAKTTDDCYTPPEIYDAIADWVAEEYGITRDRFLRPFRPGGDYQAEEYPEGCAVVDNPPFSILASIIDWYLARNIPFFLFGPTLTIINLLKKQTRKAKCCVILIGNQIMYENGAVVQTSYITNMDKYGLRIEGGGLREKMEAINDRLKKAKTATLPKYAYPMHVITGKDYRLAKYGQTFRLRREEYSVISEMDAQKKAGKQIFGSGLLISDRAAKEREQLEKAADREAARKAAREKTQDAPIIWELSEREREMIRSMEGGGICQGI